MKYLWQEGGLWLYCLQWYVGVGGWNDDLYFLLVVEMRESNKDFKTQVLRVLAQITQ